MSKIAIITDTNSGITDEEAKELGVLVVPMPFNIDGSEFFEGISLSQEEFYNKLIGGADISTSQPTPEAVMSLWDKALEDNDQVVYLPMSSGLSGACQTAIMLAEDYDGKVQVVNNQRISVTLLSSIKDAIYLANQGYDAKQIKDRLEDERFNTSIYITLDTLHYLKKGGRITPTAAALGTLLKIKPVLQIQGEKLDAFAKARTSKSACQIMLNAIKNDVEGRITDNGKFKYDINVVHTNNEEAAIEFMKEVKELFPDASNYKIAPLSLSVSCHIGPGALAVAASRVIE